MELPLLVLGSSQQCSYAGIVTALVPNEIGSDKYKINYSDPTFLIMGLDTASIPDIKYSKMCNNMVNNKKTGAKELKFPVFTGKLNNFNNH
jgi:hypothetical protein